MDIRVGSLVGHYQTVYSRATGESLVPCIVTRDGCGFVHIYSFRTGKHMRLFKSTFRKYYFPLDSEQ